jgi:hypothetical protein
MLNGGDAGSGISDPSEGIEHPAANFFVNCRSEGGGGDGIDDSDEMIGVNP